MLARSFAAARFLLLLAVLPLTVVLAQTQAANAAQYGPAVPYSFTDDHGFTGGEVTCSGTAAYRVNDLVVMELVGQIKCSVAVPISSDPDPGSMTGSTSVWFSGATTDGNVEACDNGVTLSGDPMTAQAYTVPGFTPSCAVDEVCVSYSWHWDTFMSPDETYTGEWCGPIPMGPPPEPGDTCALGSPVSVATKVVTGTGMYAGYFGRQVTLTFAVGETAELWRHWFIAAAQPISPGSPVPGANWYTGTTDTAKGSTWVGTVWQSSDDLNKADIYLNNAEPVGVWVWAGSNTFAVDHPNATRAHNTYAYGDNDPGNCHFYFGPKFRDDGSTTMDDPAGDLNNPDPVDPGGSSSPPDLTPPTDPAPAPADCDFDITDPGSWATAGICALVGLIKQLIDLIGGIVAAILDGLKALFIPSTGFMDAKLDRLSGAWDTTAPAKYSDALSDLNPGQVSGCGGLHLDLDLPGGVNIHEHVGAACGGAMAQAAGIVKLALSAMLVVGGLLASVRAVGSGFGWDPGLRSADQ